jgi:enoyl-CoA hydratase
MGHAEQPVAEGGSTGEFVDLEVRDGIAVVTFARPPINAVNLEANRQIAEAFESLNLRDDVRVAIFTSGGKGFVSGSDVGDFNDFTDETLTVYEQANVRSLNAIYHCRVPVICALHGYALGLGTCFAAVSDLVVCSEDAFFGQPEVRLGSVGGAATLLMLMPEKFVRYMALSGKYVSVQKIAEFGSIHSVVPREELLGEARKVAALIAANWTESVQEVKKAIHELVHHDIGGEFMAEACHTHVLLQKPGRDEALAAFYARHSGK